MGLIEDLAKNIEHDKNKLLSPEELGQFKQQNKLGTYSGMNPSLLGFLQQQGSRYFGQDYSSFDDSYATKDMNTKQKKQFTGGRIAGATGDALWDILMAAGMGKAKVAREQGEMMLPHAKMMKNSENQEIPGNSGLLSFTQKPHLGSVIPQKENPPITGYTLAQMRADSPDNVFYFKGREENDVSNYSSGENKINLTTDLDYGEYWKNRDFQRGHDVVDKFSKEAGYLEQLYNMGNINNFVDLHEVGHQHDYFDAKKEADRLYAEGKLIDGNKAYYGSMKKPLKELSADLYSLEQIGFLNDTNRPFYKELSKLFLDKYLDTSYSTDLKKISPLGKPSEWKEEARKLREKYGVKIWYKDTE